MFDLIMDALWKHEMRLIRRGVLTLTPHRASVLAEENADRVLRRGLAPLRVN